MSMKIMLDSLVILERFKKLIRKEHYLKIIEFLLVSFDYIFDTPEILLEKYRHIENNHKNINDFV